MRGLRDNNLQTAIMLRTSRGGRGATSFSKCYKGFQIINKKRERRRILRKEGREAYLDDDYNVNEVRMEEQLRLFFTNSLLHCPYMR